MAISQEELNRQNESNRLLKEENELLKKRLESQAESLDLSASLVDSVKEVLGINTKRTTADSNLLKVNKQINTQILNQKTGLGSISEINKRIAKNQDIINKGKVTEQSLSKGLATQARQAVFQGIALTDQINEKQKLIDKELAKTSEQGGIDFDRVNALKNQIAARENDLGILMESMSSGQQQLLFTKLNVKELEKQNAEREKELTLAEELQEKLGVAGKLNKLIGAIPGLGGAASKALKEVTEELERAAEANEKLPSKAKVAAMQFKALGKNLVKDLVDPTTLALGAITAIGKSLMSVDKEAGEFAKNMGISYDESLALRSEMSKVSRNNKDILVTSKALVETQQSLNQFFGTTVQFSDQLASDLSILSKRTNMTAETQGLIALETAKTGKSALQLTKELNLQTFELNNQKGVQMSVKQIQDAVGKTAASLQLTFKGSSKELANQVVSARALGTNLAGVEKISSALLDFESSIQSELQAELLLGKNINLEKARQAALQGDSAKVAEEVMKNTAIMNAFEEKNVIKQEAAAKALGLSRDELANMVLEQQKLETIRGFGAESLSEAQKKYNDLREQGLTAEQAAAQVGDEALANQLQTASVAARFEATMLRVQEIFIGMAEPILDIVNSIMTSVGGAEHLAKILIGIGATYVGIQAALAIMAIMDQKRLTTATVESTLATQQLAAAVATNAAKVSGNVATSAGLAAEGTKAGIMATQAAAATATNAMSTFGIGTVIAVGAVMSALAALGTYMYMKDGMVGPGGEMIVSGPKGSIQLDKDDSIIAGTNLLGNNNNENTSTNNTALIAEVKTLIGINRRILAKSSTIEMNGNQVGQEINTSERAIQ